jgi:prefoldin beta subunit
MSSPLNIPDSDIQMLNSMRFVDVTLTFSNTKKIRSDLQKVASQQAQLHMQLKENEMVLSVSCAKSCATRCTNTTAPPQELEFVKSNNTVFKLVGPVLVKQDLDEAKSNVKKRMDFVKRELQRLEQRKKENQQRMQQQQEKLMRIQQQIQQRMAAQSNQNVGVPIASGSQQ